MGGGISGEDKAHSLHFAQIYLSAMSERNREKLLTQPNPVLPCLLLLLNNPSEGVRAMSFTLLTTLYEGLSQETTKTKWFVDSVLRYREEIVKDQDFLTQALKNILEGGDSASAPPSPKRRRKTSSKTPPSTTALGFLLDLICDTGTPDFTRAGLLACLRRLDTAESFIPLTGLLKRLVSNKVSRVTSDPGSSPMDTSAPPPPPPHLTRPEREMVDCLTQRYTPCVAGCLEENTDSLGALLDCLRCPCVLVGADHTVQLAALDRLSHKFMSALPYASRKVVFKELLNLICHSSSTAVSRKCRKCIKHMVVESSIVTDVMRQISKTCAGTVREAKQQKVRKIEQPESGDSALDSPQWQRVTTLFELIQNKKKLTKAVLVVPEAFHVLARLIEVEAKGTGEYLKQLILGTITNICGRHQEKSGDGTSEEDEVIKGEYLNMDLIVQCIRSSDNSHTHHQALLLLSIAAKIAPDLLLHNMMSVFTFMGANILRQDDAYSFHVIGRILENVIPALLMACEEKSKDKGRSRRKQASVPTLKSEDMMTVVLRVFVDAIPHVPSHRKMMLFGKLMSVVGAEDYLWRLVLLVIERVTTRAARGGTEGEEKDGGMVQEEEKSLGPVTASDMEFLSSLSEEFSCTQLLTCFIQALTYLAKLPQEKTGAVVAPKMTKDFSLTELSDNDKEIFSAPHHSAKQLRHFKYATVFVLKELVNSQHLIGQMSELEPSVFLQPFQLLMETTLQLIGQITQSHDLSKGDQAGGKFWRILLHKAHDLLDGLVHLLPDSLFLDVVSGLMGHPLPLVQRRALELLNGKLIYYKEHASAEESKLLSGLVPQLSKIVRQCLLKGKKSVACTEEELVIGQLALYGLKVLCRILGSKQNFLEILELSTSVLARQSANGMVCASAMLCGAEVVSTAKAHTLEHLTRLMPLIVTQLQADTIVYHEVLLLSAITALQKIIEAVPLFLSPYLRDIIVQVCIISADSHKPVVVQKLNTICTTLATVTPTRNFLPVLEKSLMALHDRMANCAECAMTLLRDHIVHMAREDLTTFSHDLLKFFLVCLDLRVTYPEISETDLDTTESCVIEAFGSLVFKLSEAQFKPMLIQLYTWATDEDYSKDRVLVFYKLCDSLAGKLKSLFTLFAGHILKHSAGVLDSNNNSKGKCKYFGRGKQARRKSSRLVLSVLDCLQKTLAHDTEGFLTKERFDVLMQPLVDQLENELGKPSVCEDRVNNHIVPCLASLATAAHDDSLWKDMNYQILLKTRHENPRVRIWALSAIDAFHKQLGEDYTQLVPETIPFLAELMEDESDEVEKYTHKVLAAMEVSVGENLQEYF